MLAKSWITVLRREGTCSDDGSPAVRRLLECSVLTSMVRCGHLLQNCCSPTHCRSSELGFVEGIEEFLNPSRSETARSSTESPERIDVTSLRVPRTSCRTSTRQKATKLESVSVHATVNRATSRGVRRQLAGDVNEALQTPLISSTRKKTLANSSLQNVASQLNECDDTVKKETTTVQRAYSTRRSTRLTAKKSEGPNVITTERSEPVKINSFLDEVSVTTEEDSSNLIPEKNVQTGDADENNVGVLEAKVEEVCNEFEKLDVVVMDESDDSPKTEKVVDVDTTTLESFGEVDNSNVESVEIFEQTEKNVALEDLKQDSEGVCEEKQMVVDEKIYQNEALDVSVMEQDHNFLVEAGDNDANALSFNTENRSDPSILKLENMSCIDSGAKNEVLEYNGAPIAGDNLIHFNTEKLDNYNAVEVMTSNGIENISQNKDDFGEAQDSSMVVDDEVTVGVVADVSFIEEENKPSMNTNVSLNKSPIKGMDEVSDNKENEENINENEGGGDEKVKKSLNETSLRQLKKQLKALTIKNNMDESCVTITEMEN